MTVAGAFIIGLWVGGTLGFLACAAIVASRIADEPRRRAIKDVPVLRRIK
jgi:hypothetical protein